MGYFQRRSLFALSAFLVLSAGSVHAAGLGEETIPESEAADTQKIIDKITEEVKLRYEGERVLDNKAAVARRDVHAKAQGCVRAEFTVEKDLPADLKHGVFAEEKSFDA